MGENAITIVQLSESQFRKIILECLSGCLQMEVQHTSDDKYISIAEAAGILSLSRPTIYELIKEGRLTKYKIGRTTRLMRSEVISIIEKV